MKLKATRRNDPFEGGPRQVVENMSDGLTNLFTRCRRTERSCLTSTHFSIIKANEFLDNVKQQRETNKIDHETVALVSLGFRFRFKTDEKPYDQIIVFLF